MARVLAGLTALVSFAAPGLVGSGWAQDRARDSVRGVQAAEPLSAAALKGWLAALRQAADALDYQGTLVTTTGAMQSTARLTHWGNGGQPVERLEMLDGEPRIALRRQETVRVLWPDRKLVTVERRDPVDQFPGLPAARADELLRWYEAFVVGTDRVAGHEAKVTLLRPRDSLRFAQMLWTARDSGLLLRLQLIGPDGQVLESVGFSELSVGARAPSGTLTAQTKSPPNSPPHSPTTSATAAATAAAAAATVTPEGWRVLRPASQRTELEAEGWTLRQAVAGFKPTLCVRRSLDALTQAARTAIQAVYTDGLTHVSIFIEPTGAEDRSPPNAVAAAPAPGTVTAVTAVGATHTLSVQRPEGRVTVMGDVPPATLRQFVAALERRR